MNVSLTPTLETFVQHLIENGMYNSSSEVVRDGLRLLEYREQYRRIKLEELKNEIQKGIDSADRGELIPGKEAFRKLREKYNFL